MSARILTDQEIFFDGYEITSITNSVALEYGAETRDVTAYGDDTRTMTGGLKTCSMQAQGYMDDAATSGIFFSKVGASGLVFSVAAEDAAEGDAGYFTRLLGANFNPGAAVGDVYAFNISGSGDEALVRGTLMAKGSKNSTGNGTGRQLGAVSSTQNLHAALHIISASGTTPTLDVTIESDATNTFGGGETTEITFDQASAIGAQYKTAAGAITNTYYRVTWTLGGSSPVFNIVVLVGII